MQGLDNWYLTTPADDYKTWTSIASSSSGDMLAAVVRYGGIYTCNSLPPPPSPTPSPTMSPTLPSLWTLTSAPSPSNWYSIASDSTGNRLAAVQPYYGWGKYPGGGVYTSTSGW